jgi:hypothetical protein
MEKKVIEIDIKATGTGLDELEKKMRTQRVDMMLGGLPIPTADDDVPSDD